YPCPLSRAVSLPRVSSFPTRRSSDLKGIFILFRRILRWRRFNFFLFWLLMGLPSWIWLLYLLRTRWPLFSLRFNFFLCFIKSSCNNWYNYFFFLIFVHNFYKNKIYFFFFC